MSVTSSVKTVSFNITKDDVQDGLPPRAQPSGRTNISSQKFRITSVSLASSRTTQQSSPAPLFSDHCTVYVKPAIKSPTVAAQVKPAAKSPTITASVKPSQSSTLLAYEQRQAINSSNFEHIRMIKYQVAQLREQMLKVEEEVRQTSKGKHTLEVAIQDIRKALSVSQQSSSAQQKKMRGTENSAVRLFQEEVQVLSSCKRDLEAHLQVLKHHQLELDSVRKQIATNISSLSRSLQLDAQRFKLYEGPVQGSKGFGRQRQYGSNCPPPKVKCEEDCSGTDKLVSRASEVLSASRTGRGEIKELVALTHSRKLQAHEKVNKALAKNIEELKINKRDILLERAQVRVKQNSAKHQQHAEEIALGLSSGPVSDLHRTVSEKEDRPLSRLRPNSAMEERQCMQQVRAKLTRQLSASQCRTSVIMSTDQQLVNKLQEKILSVGEDSQILRTRRMSMDNRYCS